MRSFIHRAFILCCLTLFLPSSSYAFFGKSPREVAPQGDTVVLSAKEVSSVAIFYALPVEGKKVVFFAVRDNAGELHVALDACDACWSEGKGYTQDKEIFVCNNCGMRFHVTRIGLKKGNCNPHPLTFREENGKLIIALDELRKCVSYFK